MKRCWSCRKTKPHSSFNRNKARGDGVSTECRACVQVYRRTPQYKAYDRARDLSDKRVARCLVKDHNYSEADADVLAPLLRNDDSYCTICGMGQWLVKLNYEKGGPFFIGPKGSHRKMHPDRINTRLPHTLGNTRLLCPTCNIKRSNERFTDEEVLRWVREQWESIFPPRLLWWLNTEPGKGGRRHRNPNAA